MTTEKIWFLYILVVLAGFAAMLGAQRVFNPLTPIFWIWAIAINVIPVAVWNGESQVLVSSIIIFAWLAIATYGIRNSKDWAALCWWGWAFWLVAEALLLGSSDHSNRAAENGHVGWWLWIPLIFGAITMAFIQVYLDKTPKPGAHH